VTNYITNCQGILRGDVITSVVQGIVFSILGFIR